MKKIGVLAYRDWSKKIVTYLQNNLSTTYELYHISSKDEFDKKIELLLNCNLIFVLGWSWILPPELVNKVTCIGMHPSKLPKYRGGSPLQHQIINGETIGCVSFFILNEKIDKGDVIIQHEISLEGNLDDIFERIVGVSNFIILHEIIEWYEIHENQKYPSIPQPESESTYFKRRTPEESEITLDDFTTNTALDLHNKIRALQSPYPNAFVVCKDGTKLYITRSHL